MAGSCYRVPRSCALLTVRARTLRRNVSSTASAESIGGKATAEDDESADECAGARVGEGAAAGTADDGADDAAGVERAALCMQRAVGAAGMEEEAERCARSTRAICAAQKRLKGGALRMAVEEGTEREREREMGANKNVDCVQAVNRGTK